MVEIPFILVELVFTALWFACRIFAWIKRRRIDWKREAILLLLYVDLAIIIRVTLFPLSHINGWVQPLVIDTAKIFPFRINAIPFEKLFVYASKKNMLFNNLGNVAVFIPTGIILPVVYRRLNRFWKVLTTGIALSICVELLQLPISARITDIDDVFLNAIGVAVGYIIFAFLRFVTRKLPK